jgi:hypothetical protein
MYGRESNLSSERKRAKDVKAEEKKVGEVRVLDSGMSRYSQTVFTAFCLQI